MSDIQKRKDFYLKTKFLLVERVLLWAFFCILLFQGTLWAQGTRSLENLVRSYLWPRSPAELQRTETALKKDTTLIGVNRTRFHDLEEIMRRGRTDYSPVLTSFDGRIPLLEIQVDLPEGVSIPVLVQLPPYYTPDKSWPLMFAMHGGPPGSAEQAGSSAQRMIRVWKEAAAKAGWIVAAPAMVTAVNQGGRTKDRLPYEIFHQEQIFSVIADLRGRYRINPNRIVSTGISLGSNFSIALGCSHPDWLSAIVPVSTEGDSRELLLRNLASVPVYILEGSQDPNIWGIGGPNAFQTIVSNFGYDLTYREFTDRAHEGFENHYDDVLRWLDARPRQIYPREVVRVPHPAIMPISRRVHWIETDTRQAVVLAKIISSSRIEITTRWARTLKVYLHDRLVNMDRPVEIWINGVKVFAGMVKRSIVTALQEARSLNDEHRIYAAVITVKVPSSSASVKKGQNLWKELKPKFKEIQLSFWERYAQGALLERFPKLGFSGTEKRPPSEIQPVPEQTAILVADIEKGSAAAESGLRKGDILLEVGGEPFFTEKDSLKVLHQWLMRELRSQPKPYTFLVWRDGKLVKLVAHLKLGKYVDPPPQET